MIGTSDALPITTATDIDQLRFSFGLLGISATTADACILPCLATVVISRPSGERHRHRSCQDADMRIGLGLEVNGSIDDVVARAKTLAATGVSSLWVSQIFGWDALTTLAVVGREVPEVNARHRRRPGPSPPPDDVGRPGAERAVGNRGPPPPRRRALAPGRGGRGVGGVIRPTGSLHAGVPVGAGAIARRRAGLLPRRGAAHQHLRPLETPGATPPPVSWPPSER